MGWMRVCLLSLRELQARMMTTCSQSQPADILFKHNMWYTEWAHQMLLFHRPVDSKLPTSLSHTPKGKPQEPLRCLPLSERQWTGLSLGAWPRLRQLHHKMGQWLLLCHQAYSLHKTGSSRSSRIC